MKKNILILSSLFLTAFLFRFLYLDNSLWYDEACSWATATDAFGIMHNLLNIDLQHTPLYFILLKFWIKIFGQNETAMRTLSLCFGALSIPLSYIVGKKISQNAIFSSLICAVSPLLVLFSVEIRMYSMVIFLVLLSINYLIDFEQKNDKKSLIKLTAVNIFIPYTFVGGILYNISILICYSLYLFKNKKEKFRQYLHCVIIEWVFLIPYIMLITYYAKMRSVFVISHEGILKFSHIIDVIRNFFGAVIDTNVYWVTDGNYHIDMWFTILVILPCVYFIIGFIKSLKSENKFIRVLSFILLLNFILAIFVSILKINVFTSRYIIYLLPPMIMLSVKCLCEKYDIKKVRIFLILYILACSIFSYKNSAMMKRNKELAFKSVALECDRFGLGSEDVVILPFGADAPYYFRSLTRPRVFNSDFHKIVRNPYGIYYDNNDRKIMSGSGKYNLILEKIGLDSVFSDKYFDYFTDNITNIVPVGRYAVIAMYGTDNDAITNIETLRNQTKEVNQKNILGVLFKKYMCDTIAMLNINFKFIKSYQKDNFTYYIFQRIK